jgi:hypothetical protein
MKRTTLAASLALLAAACGPIPNPFAGSSASPAASALAALPTCVPTVRREIAFTTPDAKDVLEAAAVGADCSNAAVLLTLRAADGHLLWTRAVPTSSLDIYVGNDETRGTPEQALSSALQSRIEHASIRNAAETPDWPLGSDKPQDPATGLDYTAPILRDDYVAARAANQRLLCIDIQMNTPECLIYYEEDGGFAREFLKTSS